MYIKLKNGIAENYSIQQLRTDNPQVSFPQEIPNNILAEWEVYSVTKVTAPTVDSLTQVCLQDGYSFNTENQRWETKWLVRNKTEVEISQHLAEQSETIRQERNALLKNTDWTQVADAPVNKATWATYRQALRDISAQVGFPWTIDWPVAP
jgi:hypothetical protein